MLEILNETRRPFPLKDLRSVLLALLEELEVTQVVTLILCDDAAIQRLNARDRGEDAPTDVLSYPLQEPGDAMMPVVEQLGDVFVSLDTAERQARQHGHSLLEEVLTLSAHGITHLLGLDHPTEEAWQTFHHHQHRVLEFYRERR